MNNKGLTLVELLITIVVLGIIGGFTGVSVGTIIHNTRVKVDSLNVDTLNALTVKYSNYTGVPLDEVFDGTTDDDERMQFLVSEGSLTKPVIPQQSGATFEWDNDELQWNLVGGDYYDQNGFTAEILSFSSSSIEVLEEDGVVSIDMSRWNISEDGLQNKVGPETRIFIPLEDNEYTLTVIAALSEGSGGGYGIFFDTILENDNVKEDSGFILQFDRGYGSGQIIVRPRDYGGEDPAVWYFNSTSSSTDPIPTKTEDPDWWTSDHEVVIEVVNSTIDGDTVWRTATFSVDGFELGSYTYESPLDGSQVYTGFRGWSNSPTTFDSIEIE